MTGVRHALITAAKYLLGLVVLAYVVAKHWHAPADAPGTGLVDLWQHLYWPPAIPAAVCLAFGMMVSLFRWWRLARALDLPLPYRDAMRIGMVGVFFNIILPGGIGGDAIKIAAVVRSQSRRTAGIACIVFDRLIGLVGLIVVVALVGFAGWWLGRLSPTDRLFVLIRGAWTCVAVGTAGWLALGWLPLAGEKRLDERLRRLPKVGGVLAEVLQATWTYRRKPWAVAEAVGLSLLNHLAVVFAYYCAAHVGHVPNSAIPSLGEHYVFVPAGMVVKAVFPAPGGAGGSEWSFGKLYEMAGAAPSLGILASLVVLALNWLLGLAAYLIALQLGPTERVERPAAHENAG